MNLKEIYSFFVGGQQVTLRQQPVLQRRLAQGAAERKIDMNGDIISGQMYVQAFIQQSPCSRLPILLWHGGGMTGVNWETMPDGRSGWLQHLLVAGWNVYVCDAVERGRSGWSPVPEVWPQPPLFRTKNEAWQMFRIGPEGGYHSQPAQRQAFSNSRFPLNAFDTFAHQWVPRWSDHEEITLKAYHALLDRIGPAIVIGHSQGGGFALQVAAQRPGEVQAVVALEPSGAPQHPSDAARLPPHLILWGDNIHQHPIWQPYRHSVDDYALRLRDQGIRVDVIDLPQQGVYGNSHFLMLDNNALPLLEKVTAWLQTI